VPVPFAAALIEIRTSAETKISRSELPSAPMKNNKNQKSAA
jgi:hypothetical protein